MTSVDASQETPWKKRLVNPFKTLTWVQKVTEICVECPQDLRQFEFATSVMKYEALRDEVIKDVERNRERFDVGRGVIDVCRASQEKGQGAWW